MKQKQSDSPIQITFLDLVPLRIKSKHQLKHEQQNQKMLGDDDVDDEEDEAWSDAESNQETTTTTSIIQRLYQRYQNQIPSRTQLLQQCNKIMSQFETKEEEAQKSKRSAILGQPDEDGFITVSYSATATAVGSKRDLDDSLKYGESEDVGPQSQSQTQTQTQAQAQLVRRKMGGRSRKRKRDIDNGVVSGAGELQDFYRFQMRETRKKHMEDLRQQFQDDLKEVQKMKKQKRYRPFSNGH